MHLQSHPKLLSQVLTVHRSVPGCEEEDLCRACVPGVPGIRSSSDTLHDGRCQIGEVAKSARTRCVVDVPSHAYFGEGGSLRFPDLRCGDLAFNGEASELTNTAGSAKTPSGTEEVLCLC